VSVPTKQTSSSALPKVAAPPTTPSPPVVDVRPDPKPPVTIKDAPPVDATPPAPPRPAGISPAARQSLSQTLQSPIAASSLPKESGWAQPPAAKTVPAVPSAKKPGSGTLPPPRPGAQAARSALSSLKSDTPVAPADAAPKPAPPVEPAPHSSGPPRIGDVVLETIEPLTDLPEDVQRALKRAATITELGPGMEHRAFGAALVVSGEVSVSPAEGDTAGRIAEARSFIALRGSLAEPYALRLVGGSSGAKIASWDEDTFETSLRTCPWVLDECREAADQVQSRVGFAMGPMSQLDASTRDGIVERLEVRVLEPGEVITEEDGPMPGLVFVVAGRVEILEGEPAEIVGEVGAGELLFADALWAGAPAPLGSRAMASGALLLIGDRKLALELAAEIPTVAEILSR